MIAEKTYGDLWLDKGVWNLKCEPHVTMMAKRLFQRIPKGEGGAMKLPNTPEMCSMLQWLGMRYPFRCVDEQYLTKQAAAHVERITRLSQIIDRKYEPRQFTLAVTPREYQRVAATLALEVEGLLLGDDVGLGKTITSLCTLTQPDSLPCLIVCPAHLTRQWEREVKRCLPDLDVHILGKRSPYELPKMMGRGPDVLVSSYSKMSGWQNVLAEYVKTVIFDEGQELRRHDSDKYKACKYVAHHCKRRLALTATPIYNYGGEIFNIVEVLRPGVLGQRDEFHREWCRGTDDKPALKDPPAFGSWLREQLIMLRRTRKDVARELQPLSRHTIPIDSDTEALDEIQDAAGELARILLAEGGSGLDKMKAAGDLDVMIRRATGIAKAPHVAAFVEMLLENGEPVVLFGWHRTVYDIWQEKLKKYAPAMYTGSESPAAKQTAVGRFLEGQTNLLIVSLRSGAGLDGLQRRCRTAVFGELDWSPSVHEQCVGRVHRDGQPDPVSAYFLLADMGSDPMVANILGIKRQQSDGLVGKEREALVQVDQSEGIRELARSYLERRRPFGF